MYSKITICIVVQHKREQVSYFRHFRYKTAESLDVNKTHMIDVYVLSLQATDTIIENQILFSAFEP